MDNTIENLKKVELEILDVFIESCKVLGLKYFVTAGTLLGAVRHNGFIPWDDDIDVAMPRHDYEIWVKEAQKIISSKYFVQTYETDPHYKYGFAKLRNSNTTFIEKGLNNWDINHGIYIDVFPMDYYPEDAFLRINIVLKTMFYTSKIIKSMSLESINYSKLKTICRNVMSCFVIGTPLEVNRKRTKMYKNISKSKYITNYYGAYGKKEVAELEWFKNSVELSFENRTVSAPIGYDLYLTHVYGNYMELPPEEKRVAHHYYDVIDVNKSYREYRK